MRGLEKNNARRGHQTNKHTDRHRDYQTNLAQRGRVGGKTNLKGLYYNTQLVSFAQYRQIAYRKKLYNLCQLPVRGLLYTGHTSLGLQTNRVHKYHRLIILAITLNKNPAYGRQSFSRPMRTVAPIPQQDGPRIPKNPIFLKNGKMHPKRKN